MKRVAGVLLAAGGSTRMGRNKLLRQINGRSILEISIGNHLGSRLCYLCVVVPGWDENFNHSIESIAHEKLVFEKLLKPGLMSDSLKAGWRSILGKIKCSGIMISLADQPLINANIIDRMIEEYSCIDVPACVAMHKGQWGHPVVIDVSLDSQVMSLSGDKGAKQILEGLPIKQVDFEDDSVVFDVDSEDDFDEVLRRLGRVGCK